MNRREYAVSRQSNYYDGGDYSVEIAARDFEHMSPGALCAKYAGEFERFDDPREACETAIRIRSAWHSDGAREACESDGEPTRILHFTIAGNHMVYPSVADGMSASQLRRWARAEWEKLPKCDFCGTVADSVDNWTNYDTGDEVTACCQSHADELLAPYEEELETA